MKKNRKTLNRVSKAFLMLSILLLLLTGCNLSEEEKKEAALELQEKIDKLKHKDDIREDIERYVNDPTEKELYPLISVIGREREVPFVKHSTENGYSVALISNTGEIGWHSFGFPNENFKVKFDKKSSKSRLVRDENYVGIVENFLFVGADVAHVAYQYTLYVGEGNLQGETYQKNCGENCTKEVDETILE